MSVLHVITDTDRRGAQVFASDLVRELAARGRDGRLVALAPGSGGIDAPVLGRRKLGLPTLRALRCEIRDADLVVAHGSTTLPACILARTGLRRPMVYRNIGDPLHWANTPLRRARVRFFLSRVDAVVAVYSGAADALVRTFGVPDARVRLIPTGADSASYAPRRASLREAARRRFGIDADARVAVCIGALSLEKNVALAIEAVAALRDVRLLVVGDGPQRAELEALAGRLAEGRVTFAGTLADSTEALAAADVILLSSWSEGIPGVLLEASLAGVPAVATAVGGVHTVVEDGITGRVVPPGDRAALTDALNTVLNDAASLGRAAHSRCLERFELVVVADAWDMLLCELRAARDVAFSATQGVR